MLYSELSHVIWYKKNILTWWLILNVVIWSCKLCILNYDFFFFIFFSLSILHMIFYVLYRFMFSRYVWRKYLSGVLISLVHVAKWIQCQIFFCLNLFAASLWNSLSCWIIFIGEINISMALYGLSHLMVSLMIFSSYIHSYSQSVF